MKNPGLLFAVLGLLVCLTSCATGVAVQITKPSEIDLKGGKSIALLPFGYPSQVTAPALTPYEAAIYRLWLNTASERTIERDNAYYLETVFKKTLIDTKFYRVIDSNGLRAAIARGTDASTARDQIGADIILTGRITQLAITVSEPHQVKDDKGNLSYFFDGDVALEIYYEAILTKTSELLDSKTLRSSRHLSSGKTYEEVYRQGSEAIRTIISQQFSEAIKRQLAPYTVTEYRYLAEDENQTMDKRFEDARKLVVNQFYQQALELYVKVYAETKNFAAGYNAAIMREILGDWPGAITAMTDLANSSLNKRALREAERMKKTLDETTRSAAQLAR